MTDDMTLNAELLNFSGFVRELWARQVAMTQESPERTEELRQMLIDGMAAVEQTTDMERMRAALDAFDAAPAAAPGWDLIEMPTGQPNVQRLRVPGGWLYQSSSTCTRKPAMTPDRTTRRSSSSCATRCSSRPASPR